MRPDIEDLIYNANGMRKEGDFNSAIALYQKATNLIIDDTMLKNEYYPVLFRQLCCCYRKIGKIPEAISNGKLSIRYAVEACLTSTQSQESRIELALCYMNTGVVFDQSMQYLNAIEYYESGVEILRDYIDFDFSAKTGYINGLISLGDAYFQCENYTSSVYYLSIASQLLVDEKYDARYSYTTNMIEQIKAKMGESE